MRKIAVLLVALLTACASGPSDNITLVPAEIAEQTSKQGLFTQPVKIDQIRPGCSGDCPMLKVDSVIFPGNQKLSKLVELSLVDMTWLDEDAEQPYINLQQLQDYYWRTAASRDEMVLIARTRYRNKYLTVVELNAGQYRTGMAHGINGSQFINWDNNTEKVLVLADLLAVGAYPEFVQQLRQSHAEWLQSQASAVDDPANFERMWPFVASDNVALTDAGLLVKYQPYEIAPYSFGQPEILVPYSRLQGILKSRFTPPGL